MDFATDLSPDRSFCGKNKLAGQCCALTGFYEDEHHDWDHHWHGDGDVAAALVVGAAVGVTAAAAASQPTYVTTIPCSATVVVKGSVTYCQCGTTWYTRGYQSDTVLYMVGPPPGP
jgi:hypothetical protein